VADLGTAVLTIEVDQKGFEASLAQAKQTIQRELGGTIQTATQRGARGNQGGNRGRDAELRAASQLLRLRNSINILEANGVNVSKLRTRLSDLETLAADKKYKALKQEGEALRQVVSQEQNRLKVSNINKRNAEAQVKLSEKQSAASVALNKQRDAAFRKGVAQAKKDAQFAASYGPQLPKTPSGSTRSAEAAERAALREGRRIGRLNVSPIGGGVAFPGSPKALEAAAAAERKRNKELDITAAKLQKTAASERKAASQRRRDIISNVAIGAGFPLLFGQGFGAAAGGALGGGIGGALGGTAGFAGSIVGTALGQAFDQALQKAQALAQGLDDPIKNFDALRQAALLSSKAVERNAEALIAAGREEEAAALIRADLNRTFGSPEAAAEFTAATDELNRAWSQATVSLTAFVAGPLAQFLRGVSIFLGGGPAASAKADVARARQIAASSPEKQAQLERLVRQRGGRLNEEGNIAGAASVPIFREYLKLNGELTAEQKQQKALTDALSEGAARTAEANRLNLAIIEESARGNKEAAAQKELELLAIEKTRRINALPQTATNVDRQRIDQEFAEKQASAEEKLTAARQERARATFEEFQKQQQIERSIANTLQLLGAQRGEYRDTLRTIQQISTTINEARQREAEIGFQIDQARQGGREEDAARLVEQQRTAATETRARLVEGALALTEAGESLRDNLRSSVLELAKLQSGEGGLNRFLSQGLQQQRAEQTNAALQPFLREALGRFRQLIPNADLSNINQVLGGRTTAEVNANIIDFIESVNREFQATQNVQGAQAALQEVNKALVDVNSQLLGATQALAQKEWVVNIDVVNQAGGASTVNTVNSLAS